MFWWIFATHGTVLFEGTPPPVPKRRQEKNKKNGNETWQEKTLNNT